MSEAQDRVQHMTKPAGAVGWSSLSGRDCFAMMLSAISEGGTATEGGGDILGMLGCPGIQKGELGLQQADQRVDHPTQTVERLGCQGRLREQLGKSGQCHCSWCDFGVVGKIVL